MSSLAGKNGVPTRSGYTEECARLMIRAMAQRKREKVMTLRGKLG